jgi:hypothetical protein
VTFLLFLVSIAILETVLGRPERNERYDRTLSKGRQGSSGEGPDIAEAAARDLHKLDKALGSFGRGSYPERGAQPVETSAAPQGEFRELKSGRQAKRQ